MGQDKGHHKNGYAVANIAYTLKFTEYYQERYPALKEHEPSVHKDKKRQREEIVRRTWWAKCPTGETDDKHIKEWYRRMVEPIIKKTISKGIQKARQENANRIISWKEKVANPQVKQTNAGSPPPPRLVYEDYNGVNLLPEKHYCQMERPGPEDGKKIKWKNT